MCNNNDILFLLLLVKIILIIAIPIYYIYRLIVLKKSINKYLFLSEVILLIVLIIFQFIGNSCFTNSTIAFLKRNNTKINFNEKYFNDNSNTVKKIITNEFYYAKSGKKVYYFNNVELPLSDVEVKCKKTVGYMKNYGNNITAISILLSTKFERNIDPIEVLNLANKKSLVRCDIGIKTYPLLSVLSKEYNLNVKTISFDQVNQYINNGEIVLAKVTNKPTVKNVTCEDSYIIIYNVSNDNNYLFLNPSDRKYDYICPSNSKGYGTVIEANRNDSFISSADLKEIGLDYMILESD